MLPFRTLLTMLPTAPTWPALWAAANQARDTGRPEKALELYAETLAASPTSLKACLDAASHGLNVNLAFQSVDALYRRHAADFALTENSDSGVFDRFSAGRYSWPFVLAALLRAATLAPAPNQQRFLAQIFSHLGQSDQALAILRQVQRSEDATLEDDREYGRLVAHFNPAEAVLYYQGLILRWPGIADLVWNLLAAQAECGAELEMQATYAALLNDFAAAEIPDERQIHSLALLAWGMYERPIPVLMHHALANFAALFERAGKLYPFSTAALLATGFGALLQGRLMTGKQSLALATLPRLAPMPDINDELGRKSNKERKSIKSESIKGLSDLPDLTAPIETATRALLHIDGLTGSPDRAPTIMRPKDTHEHISHIQAGARLRDHDLFGALKQFGDAIAPHVVRKPYVAGETVLDRRIVYHQGKFYALPQMIGNFVIIGGMVYRIPEQVHILRPTMPRLFMRIARPVALYLIRLMSRYKLMRSLGRWAIRLALSGYAVQDVLVDSDFDAVIVKVRERAELLPGLFSTEFGSVDLSTRNPPRNTSPQSA